MLQNGLFEQLAIVNSDVRLTLYLLDILKFDELCKLNIARELATFMYEYTNKIFPVPFDNMFYTNADNHKYNTNFATNLEFPSKKLDIGNKSIIYQGVKI